MSKMHVLAADNKGVYNAVAHYPTPAGNNSCGISWKAAGLSSGMIGSTALTEGTGPGQISTAEKASIVAGDVIEVSLTIVSETLASATAEVDAAIANHQRFLAKSLKYFGFTVA